MYYITKSEWKKIKDKNPDYTGKAFTRHEHEGRVCNPGDAVCFEYLMPGAANTGCTLIYEHIHFEII